MKAENALDIIEGRTDKLGQDLLNHVVGMVADRDKVMVKFGRISTVIHQLYHSYGLQLAVVGCRCFMQKD